MELNDEVQNIREKLNKQRASTVSIALFGQPGAGKSSLINKIVGRQVAEVGVETDKTTDAARYHHNGIDLIDLPGYGTRQFPQERLRRTLLDHEHGFIPVRRLRKATRSGLRVFPGSPIKRQGMYIRIEYA
ncbi:GTPase [Salinisphaera sp.]|uniref:GTPase n=1 Tax=Salinisphaera sp. TaxID=1914330 RepID=UPI000C6B9007|nr:GTPase [Salinisphaera sp.]MBS61884.1 hypothetical protein [Salinisphaera sp.]